MGFNYNSLSLDELANRAGIDPDARAFISDNAQDLIRSFSEQIEDRDAWHRQAYDDGYFDGYFEGEIDGCKNGKESARDNLFGKYGLKLKSHIDRLKKQDLRLDDPSTELLALLEKLVADIGG